MINDKSIEITRVLLKIGTKTLNNRIYTIECVEGVINQFKNNKHKIFGHTSYDIDVENIFGEITDMYISGDELLCKTEIYVETPKGKNIKRILDDKVGFCISPIAEGKIIDNKVDPASYNLKGFTILPMEQSAIHGKDIKESN